MYLDFFGLKEAPFSIAPDPRYLYMSERHREALAHLLYGVSGQGGFIVLTGEVGTGKTTICRCFLNQIPKNTDVAYIVNPKLSARELMASICDELDIQYPDSASIKVLMDLINHYLLSAHAENRHTVLIIDEAQNLRVDVLEQLRLLTNLETSEKKLLQIILLGQPELREMLAQNELRQLAQRVTARYHLNELNRVEVGAYIKCRLAVAGRRGLLFGPKSLNCLFKLSEGIPRLINLIADRALLGAYAMQSDIIDASHIRKAYREIKGEKIKKPFSLKLKFKNLAPSLVAVIILIIGGYWIDQQFLQELDQKLASLNKIQNLSADPLMSSTMLSKTLSETSFSKSVNSKKIIAETLSSETLLSKTLTPEKASVEFVKFASKVGEPKEISKSLNTTRTKDEIFLQTPIPLEELSVSVSEIKTRKSAPFLAQISGVRAHKEDKFKAYQAIFDRWGVLYKKKPFILACDFAEFYSLRCLHKNGNWRSLLKLDRPAVLTLINELGEHIYFGLLAVEGKEALISLQSKLFWVTLDEIDRYWLGEYSIIWRVPPYKSSVIVPGQQRGDEWLTSNLTSLKLNGGDEQISLESMIKKFQLKSGLIPDGIAGSMTIIHMNSRLCLDCPKLLGGV